MSPEVLLGSLAYSFFEELIDACRICERIISRIIFQRRQENKIIAGRIVAAMICRQQDNGSAQAGDAGCGCNSCRRYAKERSEHGMAATIILVWRIPNRMTLSQAAHQGANITPRDSRPVMAIPIKGSQALKHRVVVA